VRRALLLSSVVLGLAGCNAVSRGSALSGNPSRAPGMYISTGGASAPYVSLGFVQVRGYGVQVAGFADVGHATLDGPIRNALATEAARMGGNGIIHLEFLDENPSTEFERAQAAANSIQNVASGRGGVEQKDRYVTVTGEVIRFEGAAR
jgi:hypothetical protein